MESIPGRANPLIGKLQRIEDLAEKLVYIKWSREFFVLLQRTTQELLNLARPQAEHQKLVTLAERLDQQIRNGSINRSANASIRANCPKVPSGNA